MLESDKLLYHVIVLSKNGTEYEQVYFNYALGNLFSEAKKNGLGEGIECKLYKKIFSNETGVDEEILSMLDEVCSRLSDNRFFELLDIYPSKMVH